MLQTDGAVLVFFFFFCPHMDAKRRFTVIILVAYYCSDKKFLLCPYLVIFILNVVTVIFRCFFGCSMLIRCMLVASYKWMNYQISHSRKWHLINEGTHSRLWTAFSVIVNPLILHLRSTSTAQYSHSEVVLTFYFRTNMANMSIGRLSNKPLFQLSSQRQQG